MDKSERRGMRQIGLGGGCHWCTEGVFEHVRGVVRVEQGWISSDAPHDAFSEAVIVHFDSAVVGDKTLIDIHLRTHACTVKHALRHRYRSAVYYITASDAAGLRNSLTELSGGYDRPVITQVLPFRAFKPSLSEYRDYYRTDPGRPFCVRHIQPKLDLIRRELPDRWRN